MHEVLNLFKQHPTQIFLQNLINFENPPKILQKPKLSVKLWFTNLYFVGFYSVPNLIVIIFNLVYPVFIVGCDCKSCVLERENVKTQASEAKRLLAGVSRLSFPQSEACALHMTGMRRVCTDGDNCVSRELRPSCETPARHSFY